ncbi:MAG TPA: hypothetical protein VI357_22135 [Mycobacteriales bacterium]
MDLAAPVPSPSRYAPRSRSARRSLAVLAALVPLLLPATPALAAPAEPAAVPVATSGDSSESATAAAGRPAPAAKHCTLAAGAGQSLHCFATFPAAIAYATGGRIADAPASATTAALDPAFATKVAAANQDVVTTLATSVLGIEYADANFRGASLTMTGGGSCDNSLDVDFRFGSMPSGWNDRISSFKSFSNCAQQLFRSINFSGGALTTIVSSLANVGSAANDQASSITFN